VSDLGDLLVVLHGAGGRTTTVRATDVAGLAALA
jgi:hypothetical protein